MKLTLWRNSCLPVTLLLLLIHLGCSAPPAPPKESTAGYKEVTFPNGAVKFFVPESYSESSEPEDTVAISPGEKSGITLRFNLHNLPGDLAEQFLEAQAKENNAKIVTIGNKSTITETATNRKAGHDYDMTFWQIALKDAIVIMSAEVDQQKKSDPAVKQCLDEIPKIIESLQSSGNDS